MARPKSKGQTSTAAIRLRPWTKYKLRSFGNSGMTDDEILTSILVGKNIIFANAFPDLQHTLLQMKKNE